MTPALPFPDFDDAAAMAVYADALVDTGDPRGELIHLQLAREADPDCGRLARAERDLLVRSAKELVGPLHTATSLCLLTWRRGFIVQAKLQSFSRDGLEKRDGRWTRATPRARLPRLVRELFALESARGLTMLELAMPRSSFAPQHLVAAVQELVRAKPPALRALSVELLEPEYDGWGWYTGASAPPGTVTEQVDGLYVSASASVAKAVLAVL